MVNLQKCTILIFRKKLNEKNGYEKSRSWRQKMGFLIKKWFPIEGMIPEVYFGIPIET